MLSNLWDGTFLYSPDDAGGSGGEKGGEGDKGKGGDDKGKTEETASLDYKTFHDGLPAEQQALIAANEAGLRTALGTERDARTTAEQDLRKAAKEAKEGSEAKEQLEKSADTLAELNTKAEFYEDAHKAGVTDLSLAFLVAQEEKLTDKKGNTDFEKMKEDHPMLFGSKKNVDGNIGEGTGGEIGGKAKDMNTAIRTAAGKQ